jgi:hypothetical protein
MSSRTTHAKLRPKKTSNTAGSEFGKLNSVTQKKSANIDKDTKLDDSKMSPTTKATVMGAKSEKAPTPPDVSSTRADNSLKDIMTETTVMGDAMSGKATVSKVTELLLEKKLAKKTAAVPDLNMARVKYNSSKVAWRILLLL